VIKRYLDTGQDTYKSIPGRAATINTPRMRKKVLLKAKKDRSKSVRVSARELKISSSTYQRVKKSWTKKQEETEKTKVQRRAGRKVQKMGGKALQK
jgi:hypothetical protein